MTWEPSDLKSRDPDELSIFMLRFDGQLYTIWIGQKGCDLVVTD